MEKKPLNEQIEQLSNELKKLKAKQHSVEQRRNKFLKNSFIVFLCSSSLYLFASIASLHIFNDGEIISAQKINENFQYLDNKINSLASSGSISTVISSFQQVNIDASFQGNLVIFQDTAELNLPPINSMPPGFSFRINIASDKQVITRMATGDQYDFETGKDMVIFASSGTNAPGYVELLANGNRWAPIVSSNLSYGAVDSTEIFNGTCTGKGSGSANCYENTTATTLGNVFIDNILFRYCDGCSTPYWHQYVGSNQKHLIYDPNNLLPATIQYTYSSAAAGETVQQSGSLVWLPASSSYTASPQDIAYDWNGNYYYTHDGSAEIDNFLNDQVDANVWDSVNSVYLGGSSCRKQFGPDWRNITKSEALGESIITGYDYWTATAAANVSPDMFVYIDSAGSPQIDAHSFWKRYICVYAP